MERDGYFPLYDVLCNGLELNLGKTGGFIGYGARRLFSYMGEDWPLNAGAENGPLKTRIDGKCGLL